MNDLEAERCFVLTSSVKELRKLPEYKYIPFITWQLLDQKWSPATRMLAVELLASCFGKTHVESAPLIAEYAQFWREHPELLF